MGFMSATKPTSGCRMDAVTWNDTVISPIWAKLRWNSDFRVG